MKSTWYEVSSSNLSGLWDSKLDRTGLKPHGGMSESEWFCPTTGAAFALIADGKWGQGGQYHLYYLAPGASESVNVDAWLWPAEKKTYKADPNDWADAAASCALFVRNMLGSDSLSSIDRWEPSER